MNTIKTWQERMREHYSSGDSVKIYGSARFKDAEIAELRAALEACNDVASGEAVHFARHAKLRDENQWTQVAAKDFQAAVEAGFVTRTLYTAPQPLADTGAGAWQPIETAPKDGSHVWCYAPDLQFAGFYGCPAAVWCYVAPGVPVAPTQPTHWMPLPAAPILAAKETT